MKMANVTKKKRISEYRKVQDEIKLMAGKPNGWINIDKKLKEKNAVLTANDVKSLTTWVNTEKTARTSHLKTELEELNQFFETVKEHPKALVQIGLCKKGLSKTAPMYDELVESQEAELEEVKLKLFHGFAPINPQFKFMEDPKWQALMVRVEQKRKEELEEQLKLIKTNIPIVEEEIQKEKGEKDNRIAQIKEELKELGEEFPKEDLTYIG